MKEINEHPTSKSDPLDVERWKLDVGRGGGKEYVQCSLCGFEFEKGAVTCAQGCPLGRFCKLIRCPNCGFEFPASPSPLTWFQKLFHRKSPPPSAPDLIRLDQLKEGERGRIACITSTLLSRRNTLALYGLAPGGELVLEQKWPTFILRVGETELAIEAEVAREVFLKAKSGKK